VAGNLQEVAGRVSKQSDQFGHLQRPPRRWSRRTATSPVRRRPCSPATTLAVGESRSRVPEWTLRCNTIAELVSAVDRIEQRLGAVGKALAQWPTFSGAIEAIAKQTTCLR